MGLVADGGPTATLTYTGWNLKDTGSGNQTNLISGVAVNQGNFQIGPERPLAEAHRRPDAQPTSRRPAGRATFSNDPFAVRANRETLGRGVDVDLRPDPGDLDVGLGQRRARGRAAGCRHGVRLPPPPHHSGRGHRHSRRRP